MRLIVVESLLARLVQVELRELEVALELVEPQVESLVGLLVLGRVVELRLVWLVLGLG